MLYNFGSSVEDCFCCCLFCLYFFVGKNCGCFIILVCQGKTVFVVCFIFSFLLVKGVGAL